MISVTLPEAVDVNEYNAVCVRRIALSIYRYNMNINSASLHVPPCALLLLILYCRLQYFHRSTITLPCTILV